MRKLIKISLIILVVSLIFYFLFFKKNESCPDCGTYAEQIKKAVVRKDVNSPVKESEPQVLTPTKIIDTTTMNEPEFQSWVKTAAVDLNNPSVDTKETEDKLRVVSEKLTEPQVDLLVKNSLDIETAINERILSVFLLTMTVSSQINESLVHIAKAALPDLGPSVPHSEAELKNTQELAIRYMAIDELARKASTDEKSLYKLKLLLVEAESIQIRNYVQRKLDEMKK